MIINNKLNIIIDIKGGYSVNGSGADCKSVAYGSVGSSPTPLIIWGRSSMGERLFCKQKVEGSSPFDSI